MVRQCDERDHLQGVTHPLDAVPRLYLLTRTKLHEYNINHGTNHETTAFDKPACGALETN